MKCPGCGREAEDTRFYCGTCGQELRRTDEPEDMKRPSLELIPDIDSRAITVALVGIAVSISGLIAYSFGGGVFGRASGTDVWLGWPGVIMTLGFCMIGVGVFMNWSQNLPGSVRFTIGCEVVFGISGLAILLALMMRVTEWAPNIASDGHLLDPTPVYGLRSVVDYLIIPFVWCPFIVVWGLWVAKRVAWLAGVALAIVNIPLVASELLTHTGAAVSYFMAGIQVVFLAMLLTTAVRSFYLHSTKANNPAPAP
jgi:hypothetical protein